MIRRQQPKIRKRGRIIYMTDKDAAAFGDLLTKEFPKIEFAVVRDSEPVISRFPSLTEAIEHSRPVKLSATVHGWIAPRRWRPRWRARYRGESYTHYVIANMPPGWFIFQPNYGFRPLRPESPVPIFGLYPYGATLMTCYDVNDIEVRRFIDKVYRLLTKVTVNRFARVVPETQEVVDRIKSDMFRAGHDALEVCRQRQDHYIWFGGIDKQRRETFLKPYDWSPDQGEITSSS